MNKLSYLLLGTAVFMLASCSQEELINPDSNPSGVSNVTLSLEIPQLQTRAYADGMNDNLLEYAVYDITDDSKKFKALNGSQDIKGNTNVVVQLANSHKYQVVMWASTKPVGSNGEEATNPYTVSFTDDKAEMTVDYGKAVANSDNLDAFYAAKDLGEIKQDQTVKVELRRPFAQINVGTNDYETFEEITQSKVYKSSIKLNKAYTKLDLLTGKVSMDEGAGEVTFAANTVPSRNAEDSNYEKYPKSGYDYLAMAYVLVGENENFKVTFSFEEENNANSYSREVNDVPLQRNHKTNIYGALLTSNQNLEVEIKPDTDGEEDVDLVWDGQSAEDIVLPLDQNEPVAIYRVAQLIGLANKVNGTDTRAGETQGDALEGYTFVLSNDFDLAGHEFPGIGMGAKRNGGEVEGGAVFKGTFDGQGHTISNLVMSGSQNADELYGFIGNLQGTLKNVSFLNAKIDGGSSEQVGIVGIMSGNGTISGVTVDGSIKGANSTGGIAGRVILAGTVENCVNYAVVSGKNNTAGIVGAAYYTKDASTVMTVKDCDNYGNITGTGSGIGGIVGLSAANVSGCTNYGKTVEGSGTSVGGIVGEQKAAGSVKDCTNHADIVGGTGYGTGGIVGWVRYGSSSESAAYPYLSPIVVSGNINNGKHISGSIGVGGIVGHWYCDGECKDNVNFAETITASQQFVAGIVGTTQWTERCSSGDTNYDNKKLTVTGNTTYTTKENISGSLSDMIIYDNTQGNKTDISDNKTPKTTSVNSQDGLKAALENAEAGDIIQLAAGDYTCNNFKDNIIIVGSEGTNFNVSGNTGMKNGVTFKNVKFTYTGYYPALTGCKDITYENCEFEGEPFSYSSNARYIGCTFNQKSNNNYNIWAYTSTPVYFENCTFNSAGKALLIYNEGGAPYQEVYIKNCRFYASSPATGKAAIEISSERHSVKVVIDGCTAEGFDENNISKNSLWNVKNDTNPVTVTVDGVVVKEKTN